MTKKKRETIVMIIHSLKCIFLKHLVDEIVAEEHIDTNTKTERNSSDACALNGFRFPAPKPSILGTQPNRCH